MLRNPLENNPYVARFANQPALLQPGAETWLASCLQARAEFDPGAEKDFMGPFGFGERGARADRRYAMIGNIAVIPIRGALLHGSMDRYSFSTGYDYIRLAAFEAEQDDEVAGIAYLHNSNGGEVAGNFDLVDDLAKLTKPSVAIVDENSYSASYSLASAADRIVVATTGGVGSIGVLTAHIDLSQALKNFGVVFTFIHAGKHKVDGNPMEPLGEDTKNRMQGRIDGLYNQFVATVARNRNLSEQVVRDTEALTYPAADAVEMGLADAVMAPREALAAFVDELNRKPTGANTMSTEKQQTPAQTQGADTAQTTPAADLDAARAEGANAERERIQGIMACDEAKTRPAAAQQLAYKTGMSVEDASAFLAGLPEEKPAAAKPEGKSEQAAPQKQPGAETARTPFQQAMDSSENPNIMADGAGADGQVSAADRIIASHSGVTGYKPQAH